MNSAMPAEARLAANRVNAQASTGPRTAEGKARSAANSTAHGLFTSRPRISPEETEEYEQLREALLADLAPSGALEHGHALEVVNAFWRLRNCTLAESTDTEPASIDRARAHASNILRRATHELRRLQTERLLRRDLGPNDGLASHKDAVATLAADARRLLHVRKIKGLDSLAALVEAADREIANKITERSQHPGRNAPCTCGSGRKFKRCCLGKSPPKDVSLTGC